MFLFLFLFYIQSSNLPPVVIYGYYVIARARNNSTTSGLYDKNEHRSIAIGRCCILLCGSGRFYWLLGTRC